MSAQRACYLHGLDIVRAYAPHLLAQHTRHLRVVQPVPVVEAVEPPPPPKPEPPKGHRIDGLVAPSAVKAIISEICAAHNVTYDQLCGPNRSPRLGAIRVEVYALLRERGWSLSQIGKLMCRDHTSVVHALRKVQQ